MTTVSWNGLGQTTASFSVEVLITDGESDKTTAQSTISILNRPPEISIGTDSDDVFVTNPITFFVTNSSDIDTLNPSAPVEILWNGMLGGPSRPNRVP